ncbi:MAG: phenylalanine--tRNA ligase subunit beta [Sulfuricellaceae bacterium]|nr:phenylalanine--tRNA ligase subunit beta [Sulfuricellaceae bacterium]
MKFSENWLRSYVNPKLDSEQLAHALTMAGLEVEALEAVAPAFDKIVVAEVLSLEKHPNADRLNVCLVNTGGEPLQIVCGASNVFAGARVPCALVGAELPGISIKQAKVRGVESFGMLCSDKELGLADESSGLLILPPDAPIGDSIRDYLDLDDKLITLKLTPNRSDCLSLNGVAREVAAITDTVSAPAGTPFVDVTSQASLPVSVQDAIACPRYCGRIVSGIRMDVPAPTWLTRRLERSGLRAINAVVDITNYVMLEMGQPLHAFDLGKISNGIHVRYAQEAEELVLLNQQQVKLDSDMLVIADDGKALALAGIMGGEQSAVSDTTVDIFLESAFFDPNVIAGKARRLGLSTDSSYRFERGVDFAQTRVALDRATELILQVCGGAAAPVVEVSGKLPARPDIVLRPERARRVLGIDIDQASIVSLLRRLGLEFSETDHVINVSPPSYRFDLSIEADLIEELARLHGYDNIPAIPPKSAMRLLPQGERQYGQDKLRQFLVSRDYQEVVTYSFVERAWEQDLAANQHPIELMNPISSQLGVMRSSLAGGLVNTLCFNLNRKHDRVRIFEIGRCYSFDGKGYNQPQKLAGLCYGTVKAEQWGEAARQVDFFDVKADIEALCQPAVLGFSAFSHPALHPGQAACVTLNGMEIGWLGALHPQWQQKYELPQSAVIFELDIEALMSRKLPEFQGVSKFPPVRRDLAVVVEESVPALNLVDAVNSALPPYVTEFMLFDVYRGKGVDFGKKSLAFKVLMQDTQKTLTDEEVEVALAGIQEILAARFEATLRA